MRWQVTARPATNLPSNGKFVRAPCHEMASCGQASHQLAIRWRIRQREFAMRWQVAARPATILPSDGKFPRATCHDMASCGQASHQLAIRWQVAAKRPPTCHQRASSQQQQLAIDQLRSVGIEAEGHIRPNLGHSIDTEGIKIGCEFLQKIFN